MNNLTNNKEIVVQIYDTFNTRNLVLLEKLFSTDFIDHTADPHQKQGFEGIKEVWQGVWSQFPGIKLSVEEMMAERNTVTSRVTFKYPAKDSNDLVELGFMIEMVTIDNGKIKELWNVIKFNSIK